MVSQLSSQEVIFWISLFGLDFGVPLMLPERWRIRIGAITTALSATGLAWSLGYRISLQSHVGWQAAVTLIVIGALASVAAQIPREGWVPFALYRMADLIEEYIERTRRYKTTDDGQFTDREWRKIAARYAEDYGNLASRLADEIYGYNPNSMQIARSIRKPQSLEEMKEIVNRLNSIADDALKWRTRRMIVAACQGLVFGFFAFLILHFVATRIL